MAKVRTQPDRRQDAIFTDQHGRRFKTVVERDTMHPCAALTPYGWKAPLVTPDKYFQIDKDEPFRLKIDYDSWIADLEEAAREYDTRLGSNAVMLFGTGAASALQRRDTELLRYTGPAPFPVDPVKAARQGNNWVLGIKTGPMPEWAKPFFEKPKVEERVFEDVYEDVADDATESENDIDDAFEPALTADEEALLDLEEELDPHATGGTMVPTKPRGARRMRGGSN